MSSCNDRFLWEPGLKISWAQRMQQPHGTYQQWEPWRERRKQTKIGQQGVSWEHFYPQREPGELKSISQLQCRVPDPALSRHPREMVPSPLVSDTLRLRTSFCFSPWCLRHGLGDDLLLFIDAQLSNADPTRVGLFTDSWRWVALAHIEAQIFLKWKKKEEEEWKQSVTNSPLEDFRDHWGSAVLTQSGEIELWSLREMLRSHDIQPLREAGSRSR